jgi:hypothetical protein
MALEGQTDEREIAIQVGAVTYKGTYEVLERGTLIVSTTSSSKAAQVTDQPARTLALSLLREIVREEKAAQAAARR